MPIGLRFSGISGALDTSTGRHPLKGYNERIRSFTQPQTVTQLQIFLGTINYHSCYIRDLASIAEALYGLTRKRGSWVWSAKCGVFLRLCHELSKDPVTLAFPDWKEALHIEADASVSGVGAVLGQMDKINSKVRPIDYFSSAPTRQQQEKLFRRPIRDAENGAYF